MANKKRSKKPIEKIAEIQETIIDEVEPVIYDEPIEEKTIGYEVILATSNYFIIKKDGLNVVINKRNNYKKGDIANI